MGVVLALLRLGMALLALLGLLGLLVVLLVDFGGVLDCVDAGADEGGFFDEAHLGGGGVGVRLVGVVTRRWLWLEE